MSNLITNNAYRILGLDGTANQKDILKRSKEIINRLKIDDYPEYALDINLPEKFRTEESINDALKKLQNMKNNLFEYFFWFNIADTVDENAFEHLQCNDTTSYYEAIQIWKNASNIENSTGLHYKKNLVLLYCLILVNEENDIHLKESLSNWKEIIDSDKFWTAFEKNYTVINNQTINSDIISNFRENIVKHISDIYHDLYLQHGNKKYVIDFQDVFGTIGDKTEESLLKPIYQSIYNTIEKLKKINLEKNNDVDEDKIAEIDNVCDNCGKSTPQYNEKYDDDSILCLECDMNIGKTWEKRIKYEETVEGSKKITLKIKRIIVTLESQLHQLHQLREIGLYDDIQSRVIRDHVAEAIRDVAVRLHNEAYMRDKSIDLINLAKKISGTESVREKCQSDLKTIEENIKQDEETTTIFEIGGFLRKTKLVVKSDFIEYKQKKIYYKDVISITYNVHDDPSITLIKSSKDELKIKFGNLEKLNSVIQLIHPIIEPIIIDRLLKLIFEIGASIDMGVVKFDKDGFRGLGYTDNLRLRLMVTPASEFKFVSWETDLYPAEISQGIVVLFENKNNQREQLTLVSLETPNAPIIPALVDACFKEYHMRKQQ